MRDRPVIAIVIGCGLALGPSPLLSQRLGLTVGGGVGVVSPSGSFGNVEQTGWHVMGTAMRGIRGALTGILDLDYAHTTHQGGVAGASTFGGGTVNAAVVLGAESRTVRPFGLLGVGFYRLNVDVPGFGAANVTKSAWDAGVGVLVHVGRGMLGYVDARTVSVATKPQRTTFRPLSLGVVVPIGS